MCKEWNSIFDTELEVVHMSLNSNLNSYYDDDRNTRDDYGTWFERVAEVFEERPISGYESDLKKYIAEFKEDTATRDDFPTWMIGKM